MSIKQGSRIIAGSGGGIANYDGKSITENTNKEIQTVGVINSRDSSTAIKTWIGTKAQYKDIAVKDNYTLYNITDESEQSLEPRISDLEDRCNIIEDTQANILTELEIQHLQNKYLYEGQDLTALFADEIADYSSPWTWIQARIKTANYDNLHIGDYIPLSITAGTVGTTPVAAQTFKAQIAGIDTYYRCGDTEIPHHIDFITKEVCNSTVLWNSSDCNNGTASEQHPWLASYIYAWLNGVNNAGTAYGNRSVGLDANGKGMISRLPTELQNVIITKRNLLDIRYSASALLTYSTSWDWQNMGKLWLPNEIEVYGTGVRSNLGYGQGYWFPEANLSAQYPIFIGGAHRRLKLISNGGRSSWWLSSAAAHHGTYACHVSGNGGAGASYTSYTDRRVPLCFRIA